MARKAAAATVAEEKPKRAARKTAPSPETLAALGPDRLIRLVLDEADRNAAFKKLVTAALAGLQGPDAVAALIDRRLTALERARGHVDWQKRKAFAADLDATVSTIVSELAPLDARAALDRMVRFLGSAKAVLERVDDSSGQVSDVYDRAAAAAVPIAGALPAAEAADFALLLARILGADGYGLLEAVLTSLVPGLPDAALAPLDAALAEAAPPASPAGGQSWERRARQSRHTRIRQALADRRGDVDAYIALEQALSPDRSDREAIAERLLAAGRAREALDWVRRPQKRGVVVVTREQLLTGRFDPEARDRDRVALEARILDALGRAPEAQALRWRRFETLLDLQMLRDHVAKLPDFEDEEALDRAFDHAAGHADPYRALHFLIHWPKLDRAGRLVLGRRADWDGGRYEILAPAAQALEDAQPLAATLLYRLLIDDMLTKGRSGAYGHGARHLARLDALAGEIAPGALTPDPAAYREALRKAHGRKSAFWALVKG